jgi:hypothetical protein
MTLYVCLTHKYESRFALGLAAHVSSMRYSCKWAKLNLPEEK